MPYLSKFNLNGTTYDLRASGGGSGSLPVYLGSCDTSSNTKDKEADVDSSFSLFEGVRVGIKFANTNTYESSLENPITLNVNGTGAIEIYYNIAGSDEGNTGANTKAYGYASRYNFYVYDGTYWVWDGSGVDENKEYSAMSSSELTTGTATALRTVRADYLNQGIQSMIDESIGSAVSASY